MHRTLNNLIEKDMVRPSLGSPTVYAAVELEGALESALRKHESELRELEQRKRELEELSLQQQFGPSHEASTFKVLKNIREILREASLVLRSTKKEYLFVSPEEGFVVASRFGISDIVMEFTRRGVHTRGITHITHPMVPHIQKVLAAGENIRLFEGYGGLFFGVFDRGCSISAINVDVKHLKLDEPATMLYTDDPLYATYLASTFELLWQQAVPAEKRIQELLERSPRRANNNRVSA